MSTSQQLRGRKDYDSAFGKHMRGQGVHADLLERRFALALKRYGFPARQPRGLDCTRFIAPRKPSPKGD